MNELAGKTYVVTGAGGGLGRAYAVELAAYGAAVVVNDISDAGCRETVRLIGADGGRAVAVVGSVAEWAVAESLPRTAAEAFGRFDGLVNNAGVIHDRLPWEEDESSLRRIVEVNVLGALFCGVNALKALVEQGSGAIVNVTSGSLLGLAGVSTYGATKGAVASLTYGWAVETAGTGVRVNGLMPRGQTRMTAERSGKDTSLGASKVAVPASPSPEVIAPLVVYLMSDAAGFSGRIIRHDGQQITFVDPMAWQSGVAIPGKVPLKEVAAAVAELESRR